MAGVSKGQFSNDDFIYVSRWTTFRRIREGGGFAFKKQIRFYFSDAKDLLPISGGTGLREYKRA